MVDNFISQLHIMIECDIFDNINIEMWVGSVHVV